jgi:hypothetical protein
MFKLRREARGDWHAECNQGRCATARQKATGEALFELSLAEKRSQGSEGPPHRIPDFLPPSQAECRTFMVKGGKRKDAQQHKSG